MKLHFLTFFNKTHIISVFTFLSFLLISNINFGWAKEINSNLKAKTNLATPVTTLALLDSTTNTIATVKSDEKVTNKYRHHELFFNFLFSTGVAADLVYSGLYKNPIMGGLRLGYAYRDEYMRHSFFLEGGGGGLFSPYEVVFAEYSPHIDLSLWLALQYASVFKVAEQGNFSFYLGPGTHFYGNLWIPLNGQILRYAWIFDLAAGVKLLFHWQLAERHGLSLNFYMPLLGIGWRPAYNSYTLAEETLLESGELVSAVFNRPHFLFWHNFVYLDLQLLYEYKIRKYVSFTTEYRMVLRYTTVPRERLDWQNQLGFGFLFHL